MTKATAKPLSKIAKLRHEAAKIRLFLASSNPDSLFYLAPLPALSAPTATTMTHGGVKYTVAGKRLPGKKASAALAKEIAKLRKVDPPSS